MGHGRVFLKSRKSLPSGENLPIPLLPGNPQMLKSGLNYSHMFGVTSEKDKILKVHK